MLAVITGATRGIGKAATLALARLGYRLAFVARPSKQLNQLLLELGESKPIYVEGDLRENHSIAALNAKINTEGLVPDLILLNAGIFTPGLVDDLTRQQLDDALGHNFVPALETIRPWLDAMKLRKSGRIIFIGSIATRNPRPEAAPYVLSKALLSAYAELLFHSLRSSNISVTRIIPGAIDTDTWQGLDVPRAHFIPAEDLASIIVSITQLAPQTVPEEIIVRPTDPNW
ncbi:MAG: SDR family NAD(P)-dependent oxidoreductase [Bacteroidia bacterium]|jgi:3-oxoacyl-[acyl-carrier protein] reductase